MIKISGWHRLWIVTSWAYFIALVPVAYFKQPKAEDITATEILHFISTPTLIFLSNVAKDNEWQDVVEDGITISMPTQIPANAGAAYKVEYVKGHAMALESRQIKFVQQTILTWAGPSLLLLIFGHLINWVRRGFKAKAA